MEIRVKDGLQEVDIRRLDSGVYYLRFGNGVALKVVKK